MKSEPCIFCKLASGKLEQYRIVYRNKFVVAFADNAPINTGHVLIIPIKHSMVFDDIPKRTAHAMTDAARNVMDAIRNANIPAEGFRLQLNSGKAAGQVVMHAHLHVIPHFKGQRLRRWPLKRTKDQIKKVAMAIKKHLQS